MAIEISNVNVRAYTYVRKHVERCHTCVYGMRNSCAVAYRHARFCKILERSYETHACHPHTCFKFKLSCTVCKNKFLLISILILIGYLLGHMNKY